MAAWQASGGNENFLCLWDACMSSSTRALSSASAQAPRHLIRDHCAAVKALAWCPWQRGVLASGGGTADRTIRIWNAASGACLRAEDTGSQVCSIQWSDKTKELVSSHGFSDNQIILWKYSTMTKVLPALPLVRRFVGSGATYCVVLCCVVLQVKEFRGHTSRVLHMAKSPDGNSICTASADETLRFWDMWGSETG